MLTEAFKSLLDQYPRTDIEEYLSDRKAQEIAGIQRNIEEAKILQGTAPNLFVSEKRGPQRVRHLKKPKVYCVTFADKNVDALHDAFKAQGVQEGKKEEQEDKEQ